jgi:hypothetical protein
MVCVFMCRRGECGRGAPSCADSWLTTLKVYTVHKYRYITQKQKIVQMHKQESYNVLDTCMRYIHAYTHAREHVHEPCT